MEDAVERPLDWLIAYADPVDPMLVWVALDKTRLFRLEGRQDYILETDVEMRKLFDAMRDLTFEDICSYWKCSYKDVDAFIDAQIGYANYQDETLNKTNRGYICYGPDDEDVQNFLLRIARISITGLLE